MRYLALKILLSLVSFAIIGGALLYWLFPTEEVLQDELQNWLQQQGIEAEFHFTSLTSHKAVIENISLAKGRGPTIKKLTVEYSPAGIAMGKVGNIYMENAIIRMEEAKDGSIRIPGLPFPAQNAPRDGEAAFTLPDLPFSSLTVSNASIALKRKDGTGLTADISLLLNDAYKGVIEIAKGHATLSPDASVDFSGSVSTQPEGNILHLKSRLDTITLHSKPAYVVPLSATGKASLDMESYDFNGSFSLYDTLKRWQVSLNGKANLQKGGWSADFKQLPITFDTGVLQPDQLFPFLRGKIGLVKGTVSASGSFSQKKPGTPLQSKGLLALEEVSAVARETPVSGVNGMIEFASLLPPATKGESAITIKEIVLGLPLSNGTLGFSLAKDGLLKFAPASWEWAGGTLHTDATQFNIYSPAVPPMRLRAENLALETLLSGLLKEGLEAKGKLNGLLPLTFEEGNVLIENGRLETVGGGYIRYHPTAESPLQKGGSMQTDLLLGAMENFHYDTLTLDINSQNAHTLLVVLHLRGKNPELYNGKTIELNVNLTGNLLDIIKSSLDIYTIPERLQEQWKQ